MDRRRNQRRAALATLHKQAISSADASPTVTNHRAEGAADAATAKIPAVARGDASGGVPTIAETAPPRREIRSQATAARSSHNGVDGSPNGHPEGALATEGSRA